MLNKQNFQIIGIIIFFLLIIATVFYLIRGDFSGFFNENKTEKQNQKYQNAVALPSEPAADNIFQAKKQGFKLFKHTKPVFSFEYPEYLAVGKFSEGEGEVILAQKTGEKFGFQIFINPFDEAGSLTRERILKDVPDMAMAGERDIVLDGSVKALAFYSQNSSFGETYEVWFVHNGHLYQITTYAELDEWLGKILASWQF